jgi:hypothetical protein
MDVIATWIYLDSAEESSEYPQVGKASHLPEFQQVYWRCVAVFFAISTQTNPNRKHVLFTNVAAENLPVVDGLDLGRFLTQKGVTVATLPLTWQAPKGWHGKWRNQFYIFDILQFLENQFNTSDPNAAYLVLDSDCIVNRSLDRLFEAVRAQNLCTLPMHFALDYDINGLTRTGMRALYTELDGKDPGFNPEYFGGEIFAATHRVVQQINAMAPDIWQEMLDRFRDNRPKFNEEAHFLSYCYHKIGNYGSLESFIKRIWTSPKYTNVTPVDAALPIWHLPAEKTGGIALIFKKLVQGQHTWDLASLGGWLGVPHRSRYLNLKHYLKYSWLYKFLNR